MSDNCFEFVILVLQTAGFSFIWINMFKSKNCGSALGAGMLYIGVALACTQSVVAATFINGNFDTGNLDGWSSAGDVKAVAVATGSGFQAVLTNAAKTNQDDFPASIGALNVSGVDPVAVGSISGLDGFLNLSSYLAANGTSLLDLALVSATEGSAISQSINLNAGETLSFRWDFATADNVEGDYAFVLINGQKTVLANLLSSNPNASLVNPLISNTGPQLYSFTALASGAYAVAVGLVDVNDFGSSSMLTVGEFAVSAVPEPSQWAAMIAGLLLVSRFVKRSQAQGTTPAV
jgi:hypothetical protein